jgi:hypothetical protein
MAAPLPVESTLNLTLNLHTDAGTPPPAGELEGRAVEVILGEEQQIAPALEQIDAVSCASPSDDGDIDAVVDDITAQINAIRQRCVDVTENFKLTTGEYIGLGVFIAALVASIAIALLTNSFCVALFALLAMYGLEGAAIGFTLAALLTGPNRYCHPDYLAAANALTPDVIAYANANEIEIHPGNIHKVLADFREANPAVTA